MNFRCPPKSGNPNLDDWLGEFGKKFADSATTLAGLSKSAKANFDWAGKQLVNVGGIHIGGTSLPGKGNLLVDGSANMSIYIKDATFGNAGIQLEYNAGTPRMYAGDGANAFFQFDGTKIQWKGANTELDASGNLVATSATLSGAITATSGTIGGFTVSAAEGLYAGAAATRVQMKPGAGFWAGATAQGSAPFRVTAAGVLTATSAIISGTVTIGAGSSYAGNSISVSYTDAQCTVAAADQTSANPQNLGWLIGTAGSLTISADGKLILNTADALEIYAAGNIKILDGANINLLAGGDIIFAPSDTNPSEIEWSGLYHMGSAITLARGLCIWPDTTNTGYFRVGYDPINAQDQPFYSIWLVAKYETVIYSYFDANNYAYIDVRAGDGVDFIELLVKEGGTTHALQLDPTFGLYPVEGLVDLGREGFEWRCGRFYDYVYALGGIHVGGTSDPGTDNLVVDSLAGIGNRTVIADANGLLSAP